MTSERMVELLQPYLAGEVLPTTAVEQLGRYLDLLRKWNARMNLTSVREPEQIVARHFGESIFAARQIFPDPALSSTLTDVGSGAGFPGIPIAIARPNVRVTLLEAHGKKAIFLKEAIRSAGLTQASVFPGRAEVYANRAEVVTLRAVEHFEAILPVSAGLVQPGGKLVLLVGFAQVAESKRVLGESWKLDEPVYFPGSTQRVLETARRL